MTETAAYHGLDTNSNPSTDSCNANFYLGEMGMGAFHGNSNVYNSYYCMEFGNNGDTDNTEAYAKWMVNNGRNQTYGYWFLLGPMFANPDVTTSTYICSNGQVLSGYHSYTVDTPSAANAWGQQQAKAAYNARSNFPDIKRSTIFCDVEQQEAAGWYPGSFGVINGYEYYELNRQVIIGFVQEIFNLGLVGGVCSDPGDWDASTNFWTGLGSYTSHVWVADWTGSSSECLPLWDVPGIGGVSAQIWQYCGSNTVDLDAAISLPS